LEEMIPLSEKGIEKWRSTRRIAAKVKHCTQSKLIVNLDKQHGQRRNNVADQPPLSSEIVLKKSSGGSPSTVNIVKQSIAEQFFAWYRLDGEGSSVSPLTLHTRIRRQYATGKIPFQSIARWMEQLVVGLKELHDNGYFIESLLPNTVYLYLDPQSNAYSKFAELQEDTDNHGEITAAMCEIIDAHSEIRILPHLIRKINSGKHRRDSGHFAFMSPARTQSAKCDHRKDNIYSLGMMVFQMCVNIDNDFQLLDLLDKERESTPAFASVQQEFNSELASLLGKMLEPNEEDRPDSASILQLLRSTESFLSCFSEQVSEASPMDREESTVEVNSSAKSSCTPVSTQDDRKNVVESTRNENISKNAGPPAVYKSLIERLDRLEAFQADALSRLAAQESEIGRLREELEVGKENSCSRRRSRENCGEALSGPLTDKSGGGSPLKRQKRGSRIPSLLRSRKHQASTPPVNTEECLNHTNQNEPAGANVQVHSSPLHQKTGHQCLAVEAEVPCKDWKKMKVAELRKELRQRGMSSIGKKAELISRLASISAQQNS